jgi:anti-sigma B factor antagonist
MAFITERGEKAVVVRIPGVTLDAGNIQDVKGELAEVLQPGAKLVLDLSQVRFVDSSGLGLLLSSLRQVHKTGGHLKLSGMTKSVRALFDLVRMDRVFEIYATCEDAERSFEA